MLAFGIPELFLLAAAGFIGKAGVKALKDKLWGWFKDRNKTAATHIFVPVPTYTHDPSRGYRMPQLSVYLSFPGTCEEALDFYKHAFDGEVKSIQRFSETPMPSDPANANRVMHAEFVADGMSFMASDAVGTSTTRPGTNVALSVNHDNEADQAVVFDKLADGGKVTMPLQDTFWGARFGMLTDKYDINWMFNCDKKRVE